MVVMVMMVVVIQMKVLWIRRNLCIFFCCTNLFPKLSKYCPLSEVDDEGDVDDDYDMWECAGQISSSSSLL